MSMASPRFRAVDIIEDDPAGFWVAGLPDEARVIVVGQEFVRDGRRVDGTVVSQALTQ